MSVMAAKPTTSRSPYLVPAEIPLLIKTLLSVDYKKEYNKQYLWSLYEEFFQAQIVAVATAHKNDPDDPRYKWISSDGKGTGWFPIITPKNWLSYDLKDILSAQSPRRRTGQPLQDLMKQIQNVGKSITTIFKKQNQSFSAKTKVFKNTGNFTGDESEKEAKIVLMKFLMWKANPANQEYCEDPDDVKWETVFNKELGSVEDVMQYHVTKELILASGTFKLNLVVIFQEWLKYGPLGSCQLFHISIVDEQDNGRTNTTTTTATTNNKKKKKKEMNPSRTLAKGVDPGRVAKSGSGAQSDTQAGAMQHISRNRIVIQNGKATARRESTEFHIADGNNKALDDDVTRTHLLYEKALSQQLNVMSKCLESNKSIEEATQISKLFQAPVDSTKLAYERALEKKEENTTSVQGLATLSTQTKKRHFELDRAYANQRSFAARTTLNFDGSDDDDDVVIIEENDGNDDEENNEENEEEEDEEEET